MPLRVELADVRELGPFTFRWPDAEESFQRGWEGRIAVPEGTLRFRHGLGKRTVYGGARVHSVTWIGDQPMVEGVATDDHARNGTLITRLKLPNGRLARRLEEISETYDRSIVVNHREAIDAPYSPRGLAIELREDDLEGWVSVALARWIARRPASGRRWRPRSPTGASAPSVRRARSPAPTFAPIERVEKEAVARALVAFEESQNGPFRRGLVALTDEPEAERLVRDDDFAFLLAVIFDQGVDFRVAWRAPLILRDRLGHLDPGRMLADPAAVAEAIAGRPALQRFVNNVARWTVAAARIVSESYGGDASRIWTGRSAGEVRDRLDAFPGISQKKAAMAVMLLWRNRGVDIRDMHECDVAVDIHLRRVFLRTGLVERDDPRDMIQAAREIYPMLPAALDPPAWTVGRNWCRPATPDCPNCPLMAVCPKLIDRAAGISGP